MSERLYFRLDQDKYSIITELEVTYNLSISSIIRKVIRRTLSLGVSKFLQNPPKNTLSARISEGRRTKQIGSEVVFTRIPYTLANELENACKLYYKENGVNTEDSGFLNESAKLLVLRYVNYISFYLKPISTGLGEYDYPIRLLATKDRVQYLHKVIGVGCISLSEIDEEGINFFAILCSNGFLQRDYTSSYQYKFTVAGHSLAQKMLDTVGQEMKLFLDVEN